MNIQKSAINDLDKLMQVYSYARNFMIQAGNANQWINGYPSRELISSDIEKGYSYTCKDDEGQIVGTFVFIIGDDPTYHQIENGNWLNDKPYGVIHRLASDGSIKGIGKFCFDWCASQIDNLRSDTHKDNKIMQHLMKKLGFRYCGIIYCQNGTSRLAYQKVITAK